MPTPSTVDQHLDDVALKQLIWKQRVTMTVMVRIVEKIITHNPVWNDEIDLSDIRREDMNCIGSAWRNLAGKAGIIVPTGHWRRSTKEASKGRKVWQYCLMSSARAQTFLQRNGGTILAPKQQELF